MNILKSAHQLCSIDQYDNVYISPAMTELGLNYRKLQAELKQRKDGGEPNL